MSPGSGGVPSPDCGRAPGVPARQAASDPAPSGPGRRTDVGTARGREKRAANDVRPGGAWDDATDGSGDGPLDEPGEPVVAAAPAEAAGAMSALRT